MVSLDTGKTIFEHNAGKYFTPASNAKLYTAAAVLDRLGGDYRIKTSLYSTARADASGSLKGDLIVYGRGDPTMAARLNDGDYFKGIEPLVEQVVNAGVRRIEGDLIADESFFRGPPFGSGWEWNDLQWYYGAEVSALSMNDNAVDLFVKPAERVGLPCRISTGPTTSFVTFINRTRTVAKEAKAQIAVYRPVSENIIYVSGRLPIDSPGYTGYVAVHDPAKLFALMMKEALARRGITLKGQARAVNWQYREAIPVDFNKLVDLGSVISPPLKDIVREALKSSQNLWSQLLLLQLGENERQQRSRGAEEQGSRGAVSPQPSAISNQQSVTEARLQDAEMDPASERLGIEAMNAFLKEAGIAEGEVMLEEGAGLSRRDIITPAATVELLKFMGRHRLADLYIDAMPVAAVDGTLKKRFQETPAAANLRAKTGTLSFVHALSGYVTTLAGERLAFSILINNFYNRDRTSSVRDDIDAIAVMLAGFSGHSEKQKAEGSRQ